MPAAPRAALAASGRGILRRREAERGTRLRWSSRRAPCAMEASGGPGEPLRSQAVGTRQPARRSPRGLGNRETSAEAVAASPLSVFH